MAVLLAGSGCGGITASHSISPATFFLPGFGQNVPAEAAETDPATVVEAESAPQVAALR